MSGVDDVLKVIGPLFGAGPGAATNPADPLKGALVGAADTAAALTAGPAVGSIASGAITAADVATTAATAASIGGTAAQLLAKPPSNPHIAAPQLDQAQIEADQRNALLKRKGRAASLLTPGGAQGTAGISPSLGAAALLGAG